MSVGDVYCYFQAQLLAFILIYRQGSASTCIHLVMCLKYGYNSSALGFKILTSEQMWDHVRCWFDKEVGFPTQVFQMREECFVLMQEEPNWLFIV